MKMEMPPNVAKQNLPLWTARYIHRAGVFKGCYNVEIGHQQSKALLSGATALKLAKRYLRKNKRGRLKGYALYFVIPGGRKDNNY